MTAPAAGDNDPYVVISADTHAGASIQGYKEDLDPKYLPIFDELAELARDHVI